MFIDKTKVQKSFDNNAQNYDENSFIQQKVLEKLMNFFNNTPENYGSKKIKLLELGCGTAELSKILSKKIKFDNIHLVDISGRMLKIARYKIEHHNLTYQVVDFDEFKNFSDYDFIVSNMALHWSASFEKLFEKVTSFMKPGSMFIFSIPNSNSFNFFRDLNLDSLINNFPKKELILKKIDNKFDFNSFEEVFYEEFNSPIDFLKKLKIIGAGVSNKKVRLKDLLSLRKLKSKQRMNYNISFYKIKKINE